MEAKRYVLLGKMRPSIHADVNLTVSQDHLTVEDRLEKHNRSPRLWPGLQTSDFNPIKHQQDVLEQAMSMEAPPGPKVPASCVWGSDTTCSNMLMS